MGWRNGTLTGTTYRLSQRVRRVDFGCLNCYYRAPQPLQSGRGVELLYLAKNPISKKLVSQQRIEAAILLRRGERVLLDSDLAELYGVTTKALNQAVKRNRTRFPQDFMFRLNRKETTALNRSQTVTGSQKHRDPRFPPFAFTEQGVAMLSSVLRSSRAVAVNLEIMRTFVRLRRLLASNADLALRLDELERRMGEHDEQFVHVIRAIRELMAEPPSPAKRRIGFHPSEGPARAAD